VTGHPPVTAERAVALGAIVVMDRCILRDYTSLCSDVNRDG